MSGGRVEVRLRLVMLVVEESLLCYFVQFLSVGEIWLEVEEAGNPQAEVEGMEGIPRQSHFGTLRSSSDGGRTRRTNSGSKSLLLVREA
jgi:hypothetical protein